MYINIDSTIDLESSMNLRKRAERQASQGVKALIEREKGNSYDKMSIDSPMIISSTPSLANQSSLQDHSNPNTFSNQILKQESVNKGISTSNIANPMNYQVNKNFANNNSNPHHNSTSYQSQGQMNAQVGYNYHTKNIQSNSTASSQNPNLFSTSVTHSTPQNIPQYIINNPYGQNLSSGNPNMMPSSSSRQIFNRPHKEEKEKIINRINFEKILMDKLKREGLEIKNFSEIISLVNSGLDIYLKNIIEKLVSISRARNVNLNLYSKSSEKNPIFKIHAYNLERQMTPNNQIEFSPTPYKDFSIIFTKNTKHTINMLEEYEELSLKKMRQEKMVLYKNKLEEITTQKEKEKSGAIIPAEKPEKFAQSLIVRPRGRKRESSMLKSVRNTLAKSQKKIEMDRQKKDTQNTLETFLDNKPKFRETSSQLRYDTEIASNVAESHNYETYTKLSEISKSEAQGTVNITAEAGSNDINLCVFKTPVPSQNTKIPHSVSVRRRITLKDLIFYLERERNIPFYNLVLYRAMIKLG